MEKWKYEPSLKDIVFKEVDRTHADFRIRLHFDGLPQSVFFRSIIALYLEKDPDMLNCVDKIKDLYTTHGRKRRKGNSNLINRGREIEKQFALDKNDIEDIFDTLAKEFPKM